MVLDRAASLHPDIPGLILAHGAFNDLRHPLLETVAVGLARRGVATVLRFNFAYAERGAKSPDKERMLEDTYRRAHDYLLDQVLHPGAAVFVGGKSLGGRIAAELVSRKEEGDGLLADGLVVLGYPLHAPGKRDRLNIRPLRRIDIPSLYVVGAHDPLCDAELMKLTAADLDMPGEVVVIEGGDHSLRVRDTTLQGRADALVIDQVAGFITRVTQGSP